MKKERVKTHQGCLLASGSLHAYVLLDTFFSCLPSQLLHCINHLLREEKSVCVYSGLMSLSTIFQDIMTVSGCSRELNAHFYSAATLKFHVPDT